MNRDAPSYISRTERETLRDVMHPDCYRDMLAAAFTSDPDDGRYVYFAGADDGGPVKIGVTGKLRNRLGMLRRETGRDLRVLASLPGSDRIENAYHILFDRHRLHGEWFTRCPEIEAEITRLVGEVA